MAPQSGRFIGFDPFAGVQENPQSLHKYLYGQNNSISFIDPTGLFNINELTLTQAIQGLLITLNLWSAATDALQSIKYAQAAFFAFESGDFWGGVGYMTVSAIFGVSSAVNILAAYVGIKTPANFGKSGLRLAFSGGGLAIPRAAVVWDAIVAVPVIAQWTLSSAATAFSFWSKQYASDVPIENHHITPHGNSTFDFQNHPLVKRAGVNLKNNPRNQMILANHRGRHSNNYLQRIKSRLDNKWLQLVLRGNPTKGDAKAAFNDMVDQAQDDIANGTLRPYDTKDVWIP